MAGVRGILDVVAALWVPPLECDSAAVADACGELSRRAAGFTISLVMVKVEKFDCSIESGSFSDAVVAAATAGSARVWVHASHPAIVLSMAPALGPCFDACDKGNAECTIVRCEDPLAAACVLAGAYAARITRSTFGTLDAGVAARRVLIAAMQFEAELLVGGLQRYSSGRLSVASALLLLESESDPTALADEVARVAKSWPAAIRHPRFVSINPEAMRAFLGGYADLEAAEPGLIIGAALLWASARLPPSVIASCDVDTAVSISRAALVARSRALSPMSAGEMQVGSGTSTPVEDEVGSAAGISAAGDGGTATGTLGASGQPISRHDAENECLELLADSDRAQALRVALDEHGLTMMLPLPLLDPRSLALRVASSGFLRPSERLALLAASAAENPQLAVRAGFVAATACSGRGGFATPFSLLPAELVAPDAALPRAIHCQSTSSSGSWASLLEEARSSLERGGAVVVVTGSARRAASVPVGGVIVGFSATCERHDSPRYGNTVLVTAMPDRPRLDLLSRADATRGVDAEMHSSPEMCLVEARSSTLSEALSWADVQVRSCDEDSMLLAVTSNTASSCFLSALLTGSGGAVQAQARRVSEALLGSRASPGERSKLQDVEDWLLGRAGLAFVEARNEHARSAQEAIAKGGRGGAVKAGATADRGVAAILSGSVRQDESASGGGRRGGSGAGRSGGDGRRARRKGKGGALAAAAALSAIDALDASAGERRRSGRGGAGAGGGRMWGAGSGSERRGRGVADDAAMTRTADGSPEPRGKGREACTPAASAAAGAGGASRLEAGLLTAFQTANQRFIGPPGKPDDPSVLSGRHVALLSCEFPLEASRSDEELLAIVQTFANAVCWFVTHSCSPWNLRSVDIASNVGSPGSLNAIVLRKAVAGFEHSAAVEEMLAVKPQLHAEAFVYKHPEATLSSAAIESVSRAGSRLVDVGHTCLDGERMTTVVFFW